MIDIKKYTEARVSTYGTFGYVRFATRGRNEFYFEPVYRYRWNSDLRVQTRKLDKNGSSQACWGDPGSELGWHRDGIISTDEQWSGLSKYIEEDGGLSFDSRMIEREYQGVSAFMRDLAHYCAIVVHDAPIGSMCATAHKGGVTAKVMDTEFEAMPLREFRAWLATLEARGNKRKEEATAGTPVLDWLASICDTGIIEINVGQQEVPLAARTVMAELSDWRYKTSDGGISTRGQRELSTAGDNIGKTLFNNDSNRRSMFNLANVASSTGGPADAVLIDVTRNFGWVRGMFRESTTSCWWNEYNDSRSILYHGGGYAVRLWSGANDGEGRFWVAPTGNGKECVIFNAYGTWDLHQAAALLEHVTGTPLVPCGIRDCPNGMYINDSIHYAFNTDIKRGGEVSIAKTMRSLYDSRGSLVWRIDMRGWSDAWLRDGISYEDYYTPPFGGKEYLEDDYDDDDVWCPACEEYVEGTITRHYEEDHHKYNQFWCATCREWHQGDAE